MVTILPKRHGPIGFARGFRHGLAEHQGRWGCRRGARRGASEAFDSPGTLERLGEEVIVKAYWITAGIGALVVVVGGVVYLMSDQKFGLILILGGMVVAIMGLVMRFVMAYMGDKVK
jgi:hypothetical protein